MSQCSYISSYLVANTSEHVYFHNGSGNLRKVSSHMPSSKVYCSKPNLFLNSQERRISVYSLFFRRRASPGQYMIFVTILSVSLNARKFFEFTHNLDGSDYETTSLMEYPPYIVFSNTWQELVVTGALPFIILVVSNINIYLKIRESSKHESHR